MDELQAKDLLKRYREGICTDIESKIVESWIKRELSESSWDISSEDKTQFGIHLKERIDKERLNTPIQKSLWPRVAAAVIVIIAFGIGLTNYLTSVNSEELPKTDLAFDLPPGKNKATLTLANGRTISLSDADSGALADESGIQIVKTANGELKYVISDVDRPLEPNSYNTISTPNGGQYQVILADGTKVWLNAGSSLTYPLQFNGNERKVKLSGEAYFEVTKRTLNQGNTRSTFIVESKGQRVQVLGTHFNISSYSNQPATLTTLIEGSVQVGIIDQNGETLTKELLKPSQQSKIIDGSTRIAINNIDPSPVVAWKAGLFVFDNTPLVEIMQEIERWYDIKIDYSNIPDEYFNGEIPRNVKLGEVLKVIELTSQLKFKMAEKEKRLSIVH